MHVLKFGGSSVADAGRIAHVADLVARARRQGPVAVVVSAVGGVTDRLVGAAGAAAAGDGSWRATAAELRGRHLEALHALAPDGRAAGAAIEARLAALERLLEGAWRLRHCPLAVRDAILASGERLSVHLLAAALRRLGFEAEVVDGTEVLVTDGVSDPVRIDPGPSAAAARRRIGSAEGAIPVVTGFVAALPDGATTTLGRGGSDLSASALAAAIGAAGVEIWTDVSGVLSAPPTLVRGTRTLGELRYDEAAELAFFGAKVLDERTLEPVRELGIPVAVRNTMHPGHGGTVIGDSAAPAVGARALAAVAPLRRLHVTSPGPSPEVARLLLGNARVLAAVRASVDRSWTVLLPPEPAAALVADLQRAAPGCRVRVDDGLALVAVVGHEVSSQPWIAGRALETLGRRRIPSDGVLGGASRHALCLLVAADRLAEAAESLHDALMLGRRADLETARKEDRRHAQDSRRGARGHRQRRAEARPPAA